jgi:hypothetical protein
LLPTATVGRRLARTVNQNCILPSPCVEGQCERKSDAARTGHERSLDRTTRSSTILSNQFYPCGQGRSCDARKHNEPVRLETLRNPGTWTVGLGREPVCDSSANKVPSVDALLGRSNDRSTPQPVIRLPSTCVALLAIADARLGDSERSSNRRLLPASGSASRVHSIHWLRWICSASTSIRTVPDVVYWSVDGTTPVLK